MLAERAPSADLAWPAAHRRAWELATPLPSESVGLASVARRALAADVHAAVGVPAFTASAMDGWAVAGPGPWSVVGRANPTSTGALRSGTAVEVSTGTAVPIGADAVVHDVLSAHRGRPADGVLRDVRRSAALPGADPLRRRPSARRRVGRGSHAALRRPARRHAGPHDPEVVAAAQREGIAADWIEAAQRSPVYKLAKDYRVALPLHPEYRTMPMVWYVPPLSPVVDQLRETGHDAEDAGKPLRGHRRPAHSDRVPRRAVHGG